MSEESDFRLTRDDVGSVVWRKLSAYYEARLAALRIKNDNDLDPVKTAALRGEIKVIRNLLALAHPNPGKDVADADGE